MSEHIAGEALAAYIDGALDNGQRSGVEAHLSRCPECREELAEVFAMERGREKAPAEFLRRALKVPAAGALGDTWHPGRAPMPARLVFGVAAVFLVAVVIGYFFIPQRGMKTARIAEKEMPQPTAVAEDYPLPAKKADGSGTARRETEARAVPAQEIPAAAVNGTKMENKFATEKALPGQPAAPRPVKTAEPAALPLKEARLHMADEAGKTQPQGVEGGAVGGLEALEEKDKERASQPAAATFAARAKGAAVDGMARERSLPAGADAVNDAMGLFLAATGRSAAPRTLPAEALPLRPIVRIEGDVAFADLLDPGVPVGWDWFPTGKALELTIDAAGAVQAVTLLGPWDDREAARAREEAGKLAFRRSARETRRAVLSRDPLS